MKFEEKIKLSKKGKKITFKMLVKENAKEVLETMANVAETSPFILRSAEEFRNTSIEEEEKWIENQNNNDRGGAIAAFENENLIGVLDFSAYKNIKMSHRAHLGIAIKKEYRGEGVGELFFNVLFSLLRNIPNLDRIELTVMGKNSIGKKLYEKMGFAVIGINPMAFKQSDGTFDDEIKMIKYLER